MHYLTRPLLTLIIVLTCCRLVRAEEGVLWVQVSDPQGRPIPGVVLSAAGPSSTSAPTEVSKQVTEVSGKARIRLGAGTRSADEVELVIVRAEQDLVFISPWNQRVTVPCFDDNARCVAKVVLAERGNRALLEYPPAQLAMAAKVNAANAAAAGKGEDTSVEARRRDNLLGVAKAYGRTPEEVDLAIRSLAKNTTDPYELGQVALYERNYPEAEKQLTKSKAERRNALAEVSFSLGQAYYEQGKYTEAITEYQEALALRPNDGSIHNSLGMAFHNAGRYVEAELLYKRALMFAERRLGPEHLDVATSLNNLAAVYSDQGKYAEAEPLYKRALAVREKSLGSEHPDVASSLDSLAMHYNDQGKYTEAEPLYKRALAISEKRLGSEHLSVAVRLNNLAGLYSDQGRYTEAELLFKRALTISERQLNPDHPDVSTSLANLALVYTYQKRYTEAESLLKRALSSRERRLGLEHPDVANSLNSLAGLYSNQSMYAEAEPLYKRALTITEKRLGLDHPHVAIVLENYAVLLRKTNRTEEADRMEGRAKAIQAKQK